MLEPLLIGRNTSLKPVALMLSVMLWGMLWGLTGMILAVPITAICRIYLSHVDHPLTHYFVVLMGGEDEEEDDEQDCAMEFHGMGTPSAVTRTPSTRMV